MLHAAHLAFAHPISGEWVEIDAPIPADFQSMLDRLAEIAGPKKE
jgi:hypothetical protein